jgi:septum formation protein
MKGLRGKGRHIQAQGIKCLNSHASSVMGRLRGTQFSPRSFAATMPSLPTLILASTSRYRRELLERLRLPFETQSPLVDETPQPEEAPARLALRLALAKAQAVAQQRRTANPDQDCIVIGSDQVADVDGQAIGKPGTHERAVEQLKAMSGKRIVFQTAVAVVRPTTGFESTLLASVAVQFRTLDDVAIERYLRLEQPYDCAGSAKCETLGIALLSSIESDDPTALIGLPMIRTSDLLRQAGLDPLEHAR